MDLPALAIKAALQEPRIATSLVGFCRLEEVRGAEIEASEGAGRWGSHAGRGHQGLTQDPCIAMCLLAGPFVGSPPHCKMQMFKFVQADNMISRTGARNHASIAMVPLGVQVRASVASAAAPLTEREAEVLAEVREMLAPARDMTWPSGRPENN